MMQPGRRKGISLSNKLALMGLVVVTLSLPAGWYLVYCKNVERASAAAAAGTLVAVDAALQLVEAVARERGPSNAAMGAREPPPDRRQLDNARERTESALTLARQSARQLQDPGLRNATEAALMAFQVQLSHTRQVMDAHLAKPGAERDPSLPKQLVQEMFIASDLASQLSRSLAAGTSSLSDQHQALMNLVTQACTAATLRDYAGRMGSVLSLALIRGTSLSPDEQHLLSRVQGRSEEMRRHLGLTQVPMVDGTVQQALAKVDHQFFQEGLHYIEGLLKSGVGAQPPVSASTFAEHYVPLIEPIVDLRNLYMRTAQEEAAFSSRRSQQALIGWFLLSLSQNILVLSLMWMVKRRVLNPLTKNAEILGRLTSTLPSSGHAESPPAPPPQDEVSRLTELVGSLVEQTQARLHLEARQEKQLLELRTLVGVDPLTGLENRRAVELRAQALLAEGKRHGFEVCALILDVDHFKRVNDRHGHPVGDEALKSLAGVLRQALRCEDIVGRMGGEEFMVVLGYCPLAHALEKAESIRRRVEGQPVHPKGLEEPLFITISIGVASTQGLGHLWEDLTSAADRALYRAKREGRNRVVADEPTATTIPTPSQALAGVRP